MRQSKVFLSLGSNVGDKIEILKSAVNYLKDIIPDLSCSNIYETEPLYYTSQSYFYNRVISWNTLLSCSGLLEYTNKIDILLVRNRHKEIKNGPRTLDIDILLYDDISLKTEELTVPHPRIEERLFVLIPMLEIDKSIRNPLTGNLFSSFISSNKDQQIKLIGKLF